MQLTTVTPSSSDDGSNRWAVIGYCALFVLSIAANLATLVDLSLIAFAGLVLSLIIIYCGSQGLQAIVEILWGMDGAE